MFFLAPICEIASLKQLSAVAAAVAAAVLLAKSPAKSPVAAEFVLCLNKTRKSSSS